MGLHKEGAVPPILPRPPGWGKRQPSAHWRPTHSPGAAQQVPAQAVVTQARSRGTQQNNSEERVGGNHTQQGPQSAGWEWWVREGGGAKYVQLKALRLPPAARV